mgnify:CR=1 FL=1
MAEQSKLDQKVRERSKLIVDWYLTVVMSTDEEAGWEGDSVVGKLMDFWGQIPKGSGFAGVDRMWERTLKLGSWPKQYRVAVRLLMSLTKEQRTALCIDRAYRGRTRMHSDTENQRRVQVRWSDRKCAEKMGLNQSQFRMRIKEGYEALDEMIRPAVDHRYSSVA